MRLIMAAETDPPRAASTQARGHKVEAGGGERLLYLGIDFAILSSAESTGGAFSIVEELHPLDTPLQIHQSPASRSVIPGGGAGGVIAAMPEIAHRGIGLPLITGNALAGWLPSVVEGV